MHISRLILFGGVLLAACAGGVYNMPETYVYVPVHAGDYDIATWQKITDIAAPIRIYIEGDGHSFDVHGRPTSNPTPRATTLRDMATRDTAPNVIYMARPCQYIMSPACRPDDWTTGRFSERIIDAMANAIAVVSNGRPLILIGYSGGAMISGLVIKRYPHLPVREWITVAGVLNHSDWTEYFGDTQLVTSLDLDTLPNIFARHYVAENDAVVPRILSDKWTGGLGTVVAKTTHSDFGDFIPD